MKSGPIFIGGPDRCGKTTMRAFLVSHPNISIPPVGSNMWTYFYGQYGDMSQQNNFERCLNDMLRYKQVAILNPDPDRIRREFWEAEPTYARLFAHVQEQYAEKEGKPRWGDQSGFIESYADLIFSAYPTAKMIHMIRDPRDRYEASLARSPNGKGRAGGAAARWLYSVKLARRNQERYPNQYKFVRFESLINHTEQVLQEICGFLDEKYISTMPAMEGAPNHRNKLSRGLQNVPETNILSPDFIGHYREVIPTREIAFIQALAGKEMEELDYPLDPINMSISDKFALVLFDWPLNLIRMGFWFAQEAIQRKFPGSFGRKPRAKKMIKSPAAIN